MSLIEGHAEHTMDAVGAEVLPSLPRLRAAMNRRRETRGLPWRVLERLLGLELKLRQYEVGRRFCDAVVAGGGPQALGPRVERAGGAAEHGRAAGAGAVARPTRRAAPCARGSNACSSCYKLARSQTLCSRGLYACVIGIACNNLSRAGYKQVFDARLSVGRTNRERTNVIRSSPRGQNRRPLQMPTANTTSPRSTKAAQTGRQSVAPAKPAARAAPPPAHAARAPRPRPPSAKAARTRSIHQTQSAVRQAETATRNTVGVFGDYTERAVLIPVGAALIARDRVVSSVNDTISSYGSTTKAQAQLRRFERRGSTARNRLEREVRKARVRVERELRQRRRELEKTVSSLEERRDAVAKNVTELAEPRPGAHPQPRLSNTLPPPRTWRGRRQRESLPASYPAGSSSTLSSLDPRAAPTAPRVI